MFIYEDLTAKSFFDLIPKGVQENIEFRKKFYGLIKNSTELQKQFWMWCKEYVPIAFDVLFCTLDPQQQPGSRNLPFILWDKQIEAAIALDKAIKAGNGDVAITKSRKEGATELVAKLFSLHCMLYRESSFIVASREKSLVDTFGDDFTIFAKIDNVFQNLPEWTGFKATSDNKDIFRKDLLFRINSMATTIAGKTTNENLAAGGRATGMFLDEFGRVEKSIAESIEGTIHAISNCVIYGSTHWYGPGHTFNRVLERPAIKVITLPWYGNPIKSLGLYSSPEPGLIKLLDINYYQKIFPEIPTEFKLDDYKEILDSKEISFVADGGKNIPQNIRSPWHDFEEANRDKRDFMCNTWFTPYGSSDTVFNHLTLSQIENKTIKEPKYEGEIVFDYLENGKVDVESAQFWPKAGVKRLKWWGELQNKRPIQYHNFVIGVDISWGLGNSNSIVAIYDVNEDELVGSWACPNTPPELLADLIVAMTYWVGGVNKPLLIWESNGGQGVNFGKRVKWNGYYSLYYSETEKRKKQGRKAGWYSRTDVKTDLLKALDIALAEGLKEKRTYKAIIIHCEHLLSELFDYVFLEGRACFLSRKADISTGARERHGDRVIATALCVLGSESQPEGKIENVVEPPVSSFMHRFREKEKENKIKKAEAKRYLF